MKFKKDVPNERGYYWHLIDENDHEPIFVELIGSMVTFMGTEEFEDITSIGGLWSERIFPPEVEIFT